MVKRHHGPCSKCGKEGYHKWRKFLPWLCDDCATEHFRQKAEIASNVDTEIPVIIDGIKHIGILDSSGVVQVSIGKLHVYETAKALMSWPQLKGRTITKVEVCEADAKACMWFQDNSFALLAVADDSYGDGYLDFKDTTDIEDELSDTLKVKFGFMSEEEHNKKVREANAKQRANLIKSTKQQLAKLQQQLKELEGDGETQPD